MARSHVKNSQSSHQVKNRLRIQPFSSYVFVYNLKHFSLLWPFLLFWCNAGPVKRKGIPKLTDTKLISPLDSLTWGHDDISKLVPSTCVGLQLATQPMAGGLKPI